MSSNPDTAREVTEIVDGVALIRNANTTIGYCRFTPAGDIEYLFVNPMYRRRGHGRRLLDAVRRSAGKLGEIQEPISPLGRLFFASLAVGPAAPAPENADGGERAMTRLSAAPAR